MILIKRVVFILFACFTLPALAGGKVGIPAEVSYVKDAAVRQAIKDECKLGEKLSKYLTKYSKSAFISSKPREGQYLNMRIVNVHSSAGGGYSGPKWMTVKGTLMTNGKPGPSFTAKRTTLSGGWKACSPATKCAKVIAKDIAKWLESPVDGAGLGNAKKK